MRRRILLTEICREGKISKENVFYHIVSDVEIKVDKRQYPDSIFFFKKNRYLFEQDLKNNWFNCSYVLYWSIFKKEFGMKNNEIQSFTKSMVEKYFKMKVSTPHIYKLYINLPVEKYFKMKVSTPLF